MNIEKDQLVTRKVLKEELSKYATKNQLDKAVKDFERYTGALAEEFQHTVIQLIEASDIKFEKLRMDSDIRDKWLSNNEDIISNLEQARS